MSKAFEADEIGVQVDALGYLQAQIAELVAKADAIKSRLGELPAGGYEGNIFRASVAVAERTRLDMDAVRKKLSAQFITAHTIVNSITVVRVSGKIAGKTK